MAINAEILMHPVLFQFGIIQLVRGSIVLLFKNTQLFFRRLQPGYNLRATN